MSAFFEYAAVRRRALAAFLEDAGLRCSPRCELVSCGARPEHWVPLERRDNHRRWIHGDIHEREERRGSRFLYPHLRRERIENSGPSMMQMPPTTTLVADRAEAPDPLATLDTPHCPAMATIAHYTQSPEGLGAMCRGWEQIPRSLTCLPLACIDWSRLTRWLVAELCRFIDDDAVVNDLADYVKGLLEDADASHPDFVALELDEFLGDDTKPFVLALWRYLVVEVGIAYCKNNDLKSTSAPTSTASSCPSNAGVHTVMPKSGQIEKIGKQAKSSTTAWDYKRRRQSYRKVHAPMSPYAARRDLLAEQMLHLAETSGRELILDAATINLPRHQRPESVSTDRGLADWRANADPLAVRDREWTRRQRRRRQARQRDR